MSYKSQSSTAERQSGDIEQQTVTETCCKIVCKNLTQLAYLPNKRLGNRYAYNHNKKPSVSPAHSKQSGFLFICCYVLVRKTIASKRRIHSTKKDKSFGLSVYRTGEEICTQAAQCQP